MRISSGEITAYLREQIERTRAEVDVAEVGRVVAAGDGIVRIFGLESAMYGELLEFAGGEFGMALNLEEDHVGAVILGDYTGLREGDEVRLTRRIMEVPAGEGLIGRVVNALGQPVDGKGDIQPDAYLPIERLAPGVVERQPVKQPLQTGIKAIDAMIPIGRGQRELIIGDRQTGKTALILDTILNQRDSGVICIYVAIGQKQSTVARIVKTLEDHKALAYTTVVAASASESAALLYLAPYSGCAMGEYFMHRGGHVLVVYDDLTKQAAAYRQLSLLLRRPPGREAYPGDIFYLHSRLLERAAKAAEEHIVMPAGAPAWAVYGVDGKSHPAGTADQKEAARRALEAAERGRPDEPDRAGARSGGAGARVRLELRRNLAVGAAPEEIILPAGALPGSARGVDGQAYPMRTPDETERARQALAAAGPGHELRRAPTSGGSLTAIPIIETQAGDVTAYIPTNVISITDGQIYLEADLFYSGQKPAINVGLSVSRVGGAAQIPAYKQVAGRLRVDLAQYREMEAFAQFASDLDEATQRQLARGKRLYEILKQPQYDPLSVGRQVLIIFAGVNAYLDPFRVEDCRPFEQELYVYVDAHHADLPRLIHEKKKLDDELTRRLHEVLLDFSLDFGARRGYEAASLAPAVVFRFARLAGFLAGLGAEEQPSYEQGLGSYIDAREPQLYSYLLERKRLDEEGAGRLRAVLAAFGAEFAQRHGLAAAADAGAPGQPGDGGPVRPEA